MWKSILINKNQVQHETDRAVLIKCPRNSDYKGYVFWHQSKCVRKDRYSESLSVSYTEDFEFHLKKYNKARELIDEVELDFEEFEEMFSVTNENLQEKESYFEVSEPAKIEFENIEVSECLKNN